MSAFYSLISFCAAIFLIALASAFFIIFITKTGLRDKIITYTKIRLLAELFNCDFCLSFWVGVGLSVILICITGSCLFIAAPIFTAPLSRVLV